MTTTLDVLARERYVSLTTYRKSGVGVSTPVWHAVDGGELFIWTSPDSGKVKRIRNNGTVALSPCDRRGRVAQGAPTVRGTARLLDSADTAEARALLASKYLLVRIAEWSTRILGRPKRSGIAIAVRC
ncbi:PPOX class F420-dependent oxidoreductase [Umezawaea sp. Da 62-37]|uniref:PPOX class F420-dependent oxidoreductase n=1 Tax=Umezawaea sp. Da 62-37 TaxID=3075927 RepID=UPI0028F70E2A|nr:PPOX class F420-dependent oxidoreductase [Umezawaea sp. Da 62-37]WNV88320.1 PPOX class F420-dependent oxidoreductase [Umezawaea sp. Da 62-37]